MGDDGLDVFEGIFRSIVNAAEPKTHMWWSGAVTGAVIGGISGGISAKKAGLDFWTGENIEPLGIDPYVDKSQDLLASNRDYLSGLSRQPENIKVDFSDPRAYRDVIQKLRYIQATKGFDRPVSDYFDLNTISSMDGWTPRGQGGFWTKDFYLNNMKFVINTTRRSPNLLISAIRPGTAGDGYSIAAVGKNMSKLVWVKTYSNLVYQELKGYVFSGEIPFFFKSRIANPIPNSER